ncbi:hypothetical protein [Stakelama tenebrarum]|uniref:DUF429 domain-containing protein n=1 Tax=Stakelama tenebrarum TaxID=2711215 RepID=A0A6G6Y8Z2_9SPHN|nr:hypothetical protein [Sphingosinithalassobacter tenebrarum]QIG81043.1 hypothetical protein G5C33_15465 [Sphingosinithalassobacter tenebrarum]
MIRPFTEFVAIDWSGQAVARPKGLAVARTTTGDAAPELVVPEGGWSRGAILDWLIGLADTGTRALIGLDLSPAFPFIDEGAYFPGWEASPPDAKSLWALVEAISSDDPHLGVGSFVAHPQAKRHFRQRFDCGDLFPAGRGRFRKVEHGQADMALSPYSCFNLVGASQVGKSSLTGMRVFHRLAGRIPFWPFDPVPDAGPLLVEIYTALPARLAGLRKGVSKIRDGETLDRALAAFGSAPHRPLARYDDHATDALLTAAWLRRAAEQEALWRPAGLDAHVARTEGWTFGVV